MRHSISALALSAVVAGACGGDITGSGSKQNVSLDFCPGSTPVWLAVQNETEDWQRVLGNASGTFTFEATPRVSIAFVSAEGPNYSTRVLNITRDDLEGISGETCAQPMGTKTLGGTVTGLTGQQVARLSMALAVDGVSTSNSTYSFDGLPDGPLDLVATRFPSSGSQPSDRIIVRRDLDLQSGATIPTLDFSSTEAQPLASATVTFANRGSDFVDVRTEYLSANGTQHQLMQFTGVNGTGSVFVSVPEAMRGPADLHLLTTFASAAPATREVSQFYRNPSDRTFTFGPILNLPAMSVPATTPYVRTRLTVASQPEYASAMEAFFGQLSGGSFRAVTIFTSAAFLGGQPATWELEMPDLSTAGYETTWAFPSGAQINANAGGFDGSVAVILGAAPSDSEMVRSSVRSATSGVALESLRSVGSLHVRRQEQILSWWPILR